MEQVLWKILGFILAVILMFIVPLGSLYRSQDEMTFTVVFSEVAALTDQVRDQGLLKEVHYQKLLDRLNATGLNYEISLEHYQKQYIPIMDAMDQFTGRYHTSYQGVFGDDILSVLEKEGVYPLRRSDLFFVTVTNKSPTKRQVLDGMILGSKDSGPVIGVRLGGMIWYDPN